MGPLDKYILKDDALKSTNEGFQLQFQSHWYRSLPLSCMDFTLKVNGKPLISKTSRLKPMAINMLTVKCRIWIKNGFSSLKGQLMFKLDS